jgi:hypothetical protein
VTDVLIVGVLAVAALAFVAAPLRRPDRPTEIDPITELEEKKNVALTAILDLESERDVGKLSDADFAELRSIYESDALDALHRLDRAGLDTAPPDQLEREIARVRERLSGARCANCDAPLRHGTSVCTRCGA